MTSMRSGDLVTVTGDRGEREGIVFHWASKTKVIVAVPDAARGAVMRTFPASALSAREADGAHDDALRQLIRRTPVPAGRGEPHGGGGPGNGPRGHTRAPAHRPTGR